ncbi:serine/threonine protein kinase [Myxococcus sp. K15C18031901]|uniref:serine/threonine-protein kinase n=1 Tax=Myxococcus dinghuensis TaxID=2906761 RepID=UPI0020A792DD|nr:serine/threonine-protein kinase [Myxococcus dinghuensis]MCP3103752.1 serine/threonine protein kinase [Myxococcus dinghuensis]
MTGLQVLDAPEGTLIAGYTVEQWLGAGSCGVVYRARRGREVVALKLQSLEHLGGWAGREVAILLRLSHRNVVGFRDTGLHPVDAPEWRYLAMEYVHGRPLAQWLEEENPDAHGVARLALGLARGLEAAHAAQVLHRDIKESNVVVREEDGTPVLLDFGVGDYTGAPLLSHEALPPGTPRYRSPEALTFSRAWPLGRYQPTRGDDLYALGVVLHGMLTGRPPFPDAESPEGVDAVIHQPPASPLEHNARVPEALAAVCLRLLDKRPDARGSATALCAALEACLSSSGEAGWQVPLRDATTPGAPPAPAEPRTCPVAGLAEDSNDAAAPRMRRRAPSLVVHAPLAWRRPQSRALAHTVAMMGVGMSLAGGLWWAGTWRPSLGATGLGGLALERARDTPGQPAPRGPAAPDQASDLQR